MTIASSGAHASPKIERLTLGSCIIEARVTKTNYSDPPFYLLEQEVPRLSDVRQQKVEPYAESDFLRQVQLALIGSLERHFCADNKPKNIKVDLTFADVSSGMTEPTEKLKEIVSKDLGEILVSKMGGDFHISAVFVWNPRQIIVDQYALNNDLFDQCSSAVMPYAPMVFIRSADAYIDFKYKFSFSDWSIALLQSELSKSSKTYPPELMWFFFNNKNQSTRMPFFGLAGNTVRTLEMQVLGSYTQIIASGMETALKTVSSVSFSRCNGGTYGSPPPIPKIAPPYV